MKISFDKSLPEKLLLETCMKAVPTSIAGLSVRNCYRTDCVVAVPHGGNDS